MASSSSPPPPPPPPPPPSKPFVAEARPRWQLRELLVHPIEAELGGAVVERELLPGHAVEDPVGLRVLVKDAVQDDEVARRQRLAPCPMSVRGDPNGSADSQRCRGALERPRSGAAVVGRDDAAAALGRARTNQPSPRSDPLRSSRRRLQHPLGAVTCDAQNRRRSRRRASRAAAVSSSARRRRREPTATTATIGTTTTKSMTPAVAAVLLLLAAATALLLLPPPPLASWSCQKSFLSRLLVIFGGGVARQLA